ncbi:MAG: hypothetical protein BGO69_07950 [Bacteroidetes bacterium 46-16]|nr:MAG: hypothetical protein BGO69_07950 [Bacteroidetes bacterium 46-16]
MQNSYDTPRLVLRQLTLADAIFIRELVNTPAWLRFIGNRNVNNTEDALSYTSKILDTPRASYWVVQLKESNSPIGVITLIQRDYLDHPDIGFAFLPAYAGQGYAKEAAGLVLNDAIKEQPKVLAITVKENAPSIKLLEKLGLVFDKELLQDEEHLLLYTYNKLP